VKKVAPFCLLLFAACGAPPAKKAQIPALNPEEAHSLLRYESKAAAWLTYVQKQNPACAYHVDLPDQAAQPTEIDLDHIVWCGATPGPREYNASVVFTYDKAAGHWTISRFSS
jgi:hypothetical protein